MNFGIWFGGATVLGLFVLASSPLVAETRTAQSDEISPLTGCRQAAVSDVVIAVSADGDVRLQSGDAIKVAGIRLPGPGPFLEQAATWLRAHVGARVLVEGVSTQDRWGRLRGSVWLASVAEPRDLGLGLIEAGLALADPGAIDAPCSKGYLSTEAVARQRSLGVWADAGYKPIGSDQSDVLKERTGTFAIIEGRVRSVGERAQRTYMNFGERWAEDFTVVIPKKTWKRMKDSGIDASAFKGRSVRVRGILEAWQGASLTVEIPEMIERLPRQEP